MVSRETKKGSKDEAKKGPKRGEEDPLFSVAPPIEVSTGTTAADARPRSMTADLGKIVVER